MTCVTVQLQKAELEQESSKLQTDKSAGSDEHLRYKADIFIVMY